MLTHISTILKKMPIEVKQKNELDICWDRLNTFILEHGGEEYKTGDKTERDIFLFLELDNATYCGQWVFVSLTQVLLVVGHLQFVQTIAKFKHPEFLISIHTRDDKNE